MTRELDCLIAENVFGWYVDRTADTMPEGWKLGDGQTFPAYRDGTFDWSVPYFSTDIADAWMVVMHLTASDGPHADLKWSFGLEYSSVIDWVADFTPRRNHPKAREYPAFQAAGMEAPEAICKAGLLALGVVAVAPAREQTDGR